MRTNTKEKKDFPIFSSLKSQTVYRFNNTGNRSLV
jgi:hypothetical protein